jgi:hypothetical protein
MRNSMPPVPPSEVKGAWFVTARRYVLREHGEAVFARYLASAPEASRAALEDPVVSHWYPEFVMRDALEAFFRVVAHRDADQFTAAIERCTVLGTHWFLQILVSVATPRYLLRLLPTALRQIRRGPVRMEVDVRERAATLRFSDHPNADHPCYRLATPAIMRAVLRLCVGPTARASLVESDATTQLVELAW